MTNGDKIRAMTDDELVNILMNRCPEKVTIQCWIQQCSNHRCGEFSNCAKCISKWIKEEAEA